MASTRSQGRPSDLAEGEMRERILREAARLFAEAGYAGTPVRAIVDAAGTTKPMVYYYFQGKEGLYRTLVEEAYERVRRGLEEIDLASGNTETRLMAVVEANFDLYREAPDLARFSLIPILSPRKDAPEVDFEELGAANFRMVQRIVADGIQAGEIAGRSGEVALALTGLITIYIMAQFVRPDIPLIGPDSAGRLVRLLLNGVQIKG